MNRRETDQALPKLANFIRALWPVIVSLVILISGYTLLKSDVMTLKEEAIKNEITHERFIDHDAEDQIRFAKLDLAVQEIPAMRKEMGEMQKDVNQINLKMTMILRELKLNGR